MNWILVLEVIPAPPSPNAYLRMNRFARHKLNRSIYHQVAWQITQAGGPQRSRRRPFQPLQVTALRVARNRLDMDNLIGSLKPVLDALVKASLIPDDSPRWLPAPPTVAQRIDRRNRSRLIIQVTPSHFQRVE